MSEYLIEHLVEPDRLLLSWQAQKSKGRSRFIVGELIRDSSTVSLNYATDTNEFKEAQSLGFVGYPAFKILESASTNQVLEAFVRRLPPKSRRDYLRFLTLKGIPANAEISDFAVLGYTGAKLPDDGFELIHPFENVEGPFELIIEIAGFRYESEIDSESIEIGSQVQFVPDPLLAADCRSIRIELEGRKLGYVDRGRVEIFHRYLEKGGIEGRICHKNGTSSRPLIYVFTRVAQ